jgi:glycosyltransferase involved in cell wall biosynthesis
VNQADVSVVLPTFNRAPALIANLGGILDLEDVAEVVVIDDGSVDGTPDVLAGQDDPRLRVIRHERNRGQPAARNEGARAVRTPWLLFVDDDLGFPPDYVSVLKAEAAGHDADIVGAPWVHAAPGEGPATVARARRAVKRVGMDHHSGFPESPVVTPFLPAPALVRRTVFDRVSFDEELRGNAYREETAFFVSAARAGFKCLLTPNTACWQNGQYGGGARSGRLHYEYWVARNNWRFLRQHGSWLTEQGYISGPLSSQVAFMVGRVRTVVGGYVRARLRRDDAGTRT